MSGQAGDGSRWSRIEEIFGAAVELPTGERAAYVARACGSDLELRAEVEELLAADTGTKSFRAAAGREASRLFGADAVGRRLGPYRLTKRLGQGGMGVVYLAERDDAQYRSTVAIKLLPHGLETPQAVARFRDERQILATLAHPGIVRLLDGGTSDDGAPYLVMEAIEGIPITRCADDRGLDIAERVALFRQVCAAVQIAHEKQIVHRDIKPSNILVGADGAPKLLDFGIAKLLDADREARTGTGAALLTPEYASPEQVRGEPVTTATDIYSLGTVLYELLSGAPAHTLTSGGLSALRVICEVDPPRPSVVAPAARRRALAGDLDNIVLKALRKEPAQRYRSVADLSADLQRHLQGAPVTARPATFGYRAGKLLRRHRGTVATAALLAATIAVAVFGLIGHAGRRPCRDVEAELAGVWDGTRRERIHEAFRASNRPYAEHAFARVGTVLDGYARAWSAMRTEACEATAIRGEQSPQLLDLRMRCLDQRRGELDALAGQLSQAGDVRIVDNAVAAAENLGALADCADAAGLSTALPLPADRPTRARIAALRPRLDAVTARARTGQYLEALPMARGLAAEAKAIAYPPLEAEALALVAATEYDAGDAAAEATHHAAIQAAATAHDDDRAAWAWTSLIRVIVVRKERFADSLALRPAAEAAVARAGNQARRRAALVSILGFALSELGRYPEAQELGERGLALAEPALGPDHYDLAVMHRRLGLTLVAEGRLAEARAHEERSLAIEAKELGPGHPKVGRALQAVADVAEAEGRYDEMRRDVERSLAIWTSTIGAETPDAWLSLDQLARALIHQGDWLQAYAVAERSLSLRLRLLGAEHVDTAVSFARSAEVLTLQGRLKEAWKRAERARSLFEKLLGPEHPKLAATMVLEADILRRQRRFAPALALAQAALSFQRIAPELRATGPAAALLVRIHLDRDQPDEAAGLARQLVTERQARLRADHPLVAEALELYADALAASGRAAAAVPVLQRALAVRAAQAPPPPDLARTRLALARALHAAQR